MESSALDHSSLCCTSYRAHVLWSYIDVWYFLLLKLIKVSSHCGLLVALVVCLHSNDTILPLPPSSLSPLHRYQTQGSPPHSTINASSTRLGWTGACQTESTRRASVTSCLRHSAWAGYFTSATLPQGTSTTAYYACVHVYFMFTGRLPCFNKP